MRQCARCKVSKAVDAFDVKNGTALKNCRLCLVRVKAYNARPDRKQARKKYNAQPHVIERHRIAHDTDEYRKRCFQYRHSIAGKIQVARQNAKPKAKANKQRYHASAKGQAAASRKTEKRRLDPALKLRNAVGTKIRKMVAGERIGSVTVSQYSDLSTGELLRCHLQSLFEPDMTFDNYGYGDNKWNVGHRIARAMYSNSPEDLKRCWSSLNLFPQWQKQNFALKIALPGDDELHKLQPIWPTAWPRMPTSDERVVYERAARGRA